MFKVDIKFCPWAFGGDGESWEVLKEGLSYEEEAFAFADEVASDYPQCTVRVTDENDEDYETTFET